MSSFFFITFRSFSRCFCEFHTFGRTPFDAAPAPRALLSLLYADGFQRQCRKITNLLPFPGPFLSICIFIQILPYILHHYSFLICIPKSPFSCLPGSKKGTRGSGRPENIHLVLGWLYRSSTWATWAASSCSCTGWGAALPLRRGSHQVDSPAHRPNL